MSCFRIDSSADTSGGTQGGDLRNALTREEPNRVTWWNKGKQIACGVAKGLAFLHSNRIIHSMPPDSACHSSAARTVSKCQLSPMMCLLQEI